jgi:hypothetical protein
MYKRLALPLGSSPIRVGGIVALLFTSALGCDSSGSGGQGGSVTAGSGGHAGGSSAGSGGTQNGGNTAGSDGTAGTGGPGGTSATGGSAGTAGGGKTGAGGGGGASGSAGVGTGGSSGTGGIAMGGTGGVATGGTGGTATRGTGGTATGGTGGTASGGSGGAGGNGGSGGRAGSGGTGGAGGTAGSGGTTANNSGPPMGWASWNSFQAKINYTVIKGQADAMASSGLKAAGYQYVNIDEGWWQGTRDASGNITVDSADWPGGMQAIADYIHGLGLKAGIYTDAGKQGCGFYYPTGRPAAPNSGAEGHYDQDFLQFSKWGFDYVKVDWCGGQAEGLNAKTAYQAISDSIKKATAETGRPMVLSVCEWGSNQPWNWAPSMSTLWRTSSDINIYSYNSIFSNFDSAQHPTAQSPGHYNDPDMLIVGMSGFTAAQNRNHMAMWAILSAPLLAGNQLDTMNADTKSVLTNSEVIAIDQDPLAKQATKVSDSNGLQVYSKVLSGAGKRAVLLLNRGSATATITVRFADIGLGTTVSVRDVWAAKDLGQQTTSYGASVASNNSVLLLVTDGAAQ